MATGVHIDLIEATKIHNKTAAHVSFADDGNNPVVGAVVHYTINVAHDGGTSPWSYGTATTDAEGDIVTQGVNAKSGDVVNVVIQGVDGTDYNYTTDPNSWTQLNV